MSWVSVAVSVGGALLSASQQSDAAEGASSAQGESSAAAIGEQRRQYDLTRADNAQYRNTGSTANKRLAQLLGLPGSEDPFGVGSDDWLKKNVLPLIRKNQAASGQPLPDTWEPTDAMLQEWRTGYGIGPATPSADFGSLLKKFSVDDLNADPVYNSGLKFGLDQGTDAINARATQAGSYDSGATLKALTRFGNDYGSTKANESRNRFVSDQDSVFNRLSGVSGSGQTATAQTAAAGTNMTNNVTDLITGAGNARAAGIVGGANAWSGAAGGVNSAMNNWQSNETLKRLLAGRSSGYSGSAYAP